MEFCPTSRATSGHKSLLLFLVCVLSGIAALAVEPPGWWDDPIREDPGHYFFTGFGQSAQGFEDAFEQAQQVALRQILDRAGGGTTIEARRYLLARIRGWTVHARDEARVDRNFHVWIIIKYSKNDLAALREIAGGGDSRYQEAVRLANGRQWQQALDVLDTLERAYPLGMQPLFRTEKAILLAGQCYEGAERYREATETYERLLNTVSNPTVRKDTRSALERVRRKLPDHVEAQVTELSRATVLELLASQQYLSALSMAELLVEKDFQSAEALDLLARSHAALGNLDVSLEYYGLAARAASPTAFRLVRVKAQEMASQVFSARCIQMLREHAYGRTTWALLIDPLLRDHPDLSSFISGFMGSVAQSELNLQQVDWLLLEEWVRVSEKRSVDVLADASTLRASCLEAGVGMADLVLLVREGPGSNRAAVAVQGVLYGTEHPVSVSVDVIISQAIATGATLEAALDAVAEDRLDEAATMFDQMGNQTFAALLRDASNLRRACRSLTKESTITPDVRAEFERLMHALGSSLIVWMPESDTDSRLSELIRTGMRRWLNEVEAGFPSVGGNKLDLIAVLNQCRSFGKAMNLPPIEQRHPNSVRAYAEYAERYRSSPPWALSKGIWIDADTGLSLEVEDRLFEIPFRLIPAGKAFFGDARHDKGIVLSAFYVQSHETTNREFLRFCDETGWQIPEHLVRNTAFGQLEQPVTHVTHLDAMRYSQWLGSKFRDEQESVSWKCELPTEAQWEKSARLHFPFDYPWGANTKPTASLAQRRLGAPEIASRLNEDTAITDVMGLGGNVREWCRDGWTADAVDTITPGARDPVLGVQWDNRKVVKGGAYFSESPDDLTIVSRRAFEPGNTERSLGFRVVVNIMYRE